MLLVSLSALAANQETFATLQVGEQTFQNVRVTTKGKNFIIIQHSGGIASIKTSQLPADILQKLGYLPAPKPKKHTKSGAMWAGVAIPKMDTSRLKSVASKLSQAWDKSRLTAKLQLLKSDRRLILLASAILLTIYLFCCYCCMLICQKTGHQPGFWVWLPFIQVFPMLQAASMSPLWFIALFVPGFNVVVYALWCVKICEARQKTLPVTILLLFPLTSWFAFLFLAFSDAAERRGKERLAGFMTPQAA